MNNRRGFSLIELLAVIVILGILMSITIYSVSKIIEKSRTEKNNQEVKTATLAAKSYIQSNREKAPKSIGESKIITLTELKNSKYLTENVVNSDGKSCMSKSYIEVTKTGKTTYDYKPHIYCGSEVPPPGEEIDPPVLLNDIEFSASNDVNTASFSFTILGSATDSDMEISSYSYTISTKTEGQTNFQEVYNSGVKNGENRTSIEINEKIKKYVNLTGTTSIKITVLARNRIGGSLEKSADTGTGEYSDYQDGTAPFCEAGSASILQQQQASPGQWFNRDDYERTKRGKSIQVKCNDGSGSGCIRDVFSQTWPNNQVVNGTQPYIYGAKYAWIYIKDNAGNDGTVTNSLPNNWNDSRDVNNRNDSSGDYRCLVRVNVDILEPEVTLTVKAKSSGATLKTVTVGGLNNGERRATETTIDFNQYGLSTGYDGNQWFNKSNSGGGPLIHFSAKDNIELDSWTWETNIGGVQSKTTYSANERKVTTSGADSRSANFPVPSNLLTDDNIYENDITLATDGVRWGKLTVKDKAGNKTIINIRAYVDKTPPSNQSITIKTAKLEENDVRAQNGESYTQSKWTNKYVRAYIASADKKDNVSGFARGKYNIYNENGTKIVTDSSDPNKDKYSVKKDYSSFVFTSAYQGKNKAEFLMCDNAKNCSSAISNKASVWLDTKAPECIVSQEVVKDGNTYSPDLQLSSDGWAGLGEAVKVTATCNDVLDGGAITQSGCISTSNSKTYKLDMNASNVGDKNIGKGSEFRDAAGNITKCEANQTVKIDHKAPTCSTSIKYIGGDAKLSNGWLSKEESAKVTATCNDEVQDGVISGCKTQSISKTYSEEIVTTTAGAVNINQGGQLFDKADNVVNCPADKTVKIDKHPPTCEVTKKSYNSSNQEITPNSSGWLKTGEYVIVKGICNDTGGSGCTSNTQKTYKYSTNTILNTDKAGPNGENGVYTFRDLAGNVSENCENSQTVKIDAVKPTCTYTNCPPEKWINNLTSNVSYGCNDTGSGCEQDVYGNKALNSNRISTTISSYTIKDQAGNTATCASKTCETPVDATAPTAKCKLGTNSIEDNGSTDTGGSGILSRYYYISTSSTPPANTSNKWGSDKEIKKDCGNKKYYYYMIVKDKAGNISSPATCGNKTTKSCCSESNPKGCTWKTSCRNGKTYIYSNSAKTTFAGTIYHWKDSGCSDKLYLIEGSNSGKLYIESPCGMRECWTGNCDYAWIDGNCIGGNNSECSYSQCPA